ncbi:E3 ubiquitin-protein transferase RMND5B isoform X2 [Camelus dromedarius]|uniref:E3 ubiquitin-protein transferase RMND5B isoform X2 n=1 Tax=Camelus dromedarius TaxID=9838 RepID=UPI00311918E8
MEQCASVEREVDKVLQKFLAYGQHCEQSLEELLHHVGQLRAELASAALQGTPLSATLSLVMSQCCQKIKDTVQKLASDHKDIHSSVSRVGKAIDRNFDSEICGVVSDAVWDSREKQQQILQMAIVEHLYQQGMLSVAEELCQESTLNVDLDFKQPFLELNRILEALHEQDLGPALEWAISHRQRLLELNSSLEFKLHRLHFIRLLAGGPEKQLEALSYARHFQPFARLHQRDPGDDGQSGVPAAGLGEVPLLPPPGQQPLGRNLRDLYARCLFPAGAFRGVPPQRQLCLWLCGAARADEHQSCDRAEAVHRGLESQGRVTD